VGALWRKLFTRTAPADEAHGLSMINKATGMAIRCECDPCTYGDLLKKASWKIVTICPCESCDPIQPLLGDPVPGAYNCEAQGRQAVALDFGGEDWPGECLLAKRMFIFQAATHQLAARPDGVSSYTATVYYQPPCGAVQNLGQYSGAYPEAGGGIGDTNEYCYDPNDPDQKNIMYLSAVELSDEGIHAASLRIELKDAGGAVVSSYSRRFGILVIPRIETEAGGPVEHGGVWVVPSFYDFGGCQEKIKYETGEETFTDALGRVVDLKGPFDTKEDAESVLSMFETLIRAYADTCVCGGVGSGGSECNVSSEDFEGPIPPVFDPGEFVICISSGTGISPSNADRLLIIEVNSDDWTINLEPGTRVLPACQSPIPPDGLVIHTGGGEGAVTWAIGVYSLFGVPNCKFCEDPNDPDAPEGCIYSNSEWGAIPNSSAELEELMGGE
jgi:hypothetical protein